MASAASASTALILLLLSFTSVSCARVGRHKSRSVLATKHTVTGNSTVIGNSSSQPCSEHAAVNEWKPSTDDTCYLRMYRCENQAKGFLKNINAGDAVWALEPYGCDAFGSWLHVWRISVKRSVLEQQNPYRMCNGAECLSKHFGWQQDMGYKWFVLPEATRGSEYEIHCLERTISIDPCFKTYAFGDLSTDDAVAKFKEVVIDSTTSPGCEHQSHGAWDYDECPITATTISADPGIPMSPSCSASSDCKRDGVGPEETYGWCMDCALNDDKTPKGWKGDWTGDAMRRDLATQCADGKKGYCMQGPGFTSFCKALNIDGNCP